VNVPRTATVPGATADDLRMMERCVELSRQATRDGENPFACVVCRRDEVIAEATTRAKRDADTIRHAEILALEQAQRKMPASRLRDCTIYCNVEPCAMCSFCIRELGLGRVVFALASPIMGGVSKWNILGDEELSASLPEIFHKPPEVIAGLMEAEAEQVWRDWHPFDWAIIKRRHAIGTPPQLETAAPNVARKPRWFAGIMPWRNRRRPKE